nr:TauD/TfdA family dioxygenase [Nocardiopsis salina]
MLCAVHLPPYGGDATWVDTVTVHQALPQPVKALADGPRGAQQRPRLRCREPGARSHGRPEGVPRAVRLDRVQDRAPS